MADLKIALARVRAALERAESEYPHLAAPDGAVAVQFADLRLLVEAIDGTTAVPVVRMGKQ